MRGMSSCTRHGWLGLWLVALACSNGASEPRTQPPATRATAIKAEVQPYPPGRWRLSSLETLQNCVLWVSHILIRYQGSSRQAPGTFIPWYPLPKAPERGRSEALALAREIASKASLDPSHFAELAKVYSEDTATAPQGGSLGGLRASDLYLSEPLLDALAAMSPGSVSQVVETGSGFHILYRSAPPEPETVSGDRIVIRYADASSLPEALDRTAPRRSREEAFELASRLALQVAQKPQTFPELVQRYSEHADKSEGGYIGSWSSREPTHLPREVELLARMKVGEVGPPLDSVYGFEILRRTAPRAPSEPYAVEVVRSRFDSTSAESEQQGYAQMRGWLDSLREHPERFDELRRTVCCRDPERWYRGRRPGFTGAVADLAIGELSAQPLREYGTFAIVRRIELESVPAPGPFSLELPSPVAPDLDEVVVYYSPQAVLAELNDALQWVGKRAELSSAEIEALRAHPVGDFSDGRPRSLAAALREFLAHAESSLRAETFALYRRRLDSQFEDHLLHRASARSLDPEAGG